MRNIIPAESEGEQENAAPLESSPDRFPIELAEKGYYFLDDEPKLREGIIVHYYYRSSRGRESHLLERFALLKTIEGLHYVFRLEEQYDHVFALIWGTQEYEFATTNLKPEGQNELANTLAGFIESVSGGADIKVRSVRVSPADASYSSREIEECMNAVLALPENTLSREELAEQYKSFQIFDRYHKLSGRDFLPEHYNKRSRREGRSRLFKRFFRKNLSNWEIENDEYGGPGFTLRKREKREDTAPHLP